LVNGRAADLRAECERLDGRPYPAYRALGRTQYRVERHVLVVEHVQGDPFAAPSRVRVDVPPDVCTLPPDAVADADARRASADYLHRVLVAALRRHARGPGSGRSGLVEVEPPGPAVLERTAVEVVPDGAVVIRLRVGLPAAGRRILGRAAAALLADDIPALLDRSLAAPNLDHAELCRHVETVEDQVALRAELARRGLVAFLAEGSVLPRRSGVDQRPLPDAIPLAGVPDSLAVELTAPHAGRLRGLGIRTGVTLIVGGGYHGKSTLLDAVAHAVYDHPPGDGRERCVTRAGAVVVRAEDGRSVRGVDLRPFIDRLPLGRASERFDTEDASGSTSQAAAIVEALEAGADALLVDEDTAATNFMVRDARMRRVIPADAEPITPYLDRVRQLHAERGVSTVMVAGGAGDWLDVADDVIQMQDYRVHDASARAADVVRALPLGEAAPHPPGPWPVAVPRVPDPASLDPSRGREDLHARPRPRFHDLHARPRPRFRRERVRAVRDRLIEYGEEEIDVSLLAQIVEPGQCRMIGDALVALARGLADGRRSVAELLDALDARMAAEGLAAVTAPSFGDRSRARRYEIAAALNRLRRLRLG
jgi:predicted ABC-class ATPase